MKNQKLFDKIRVSLDDEEALKQEPLEWSKEEVWQKIEQRQHQKNKKSWWPFAATAALAVMMGGYVWFLAMVEVEKTNKNHLSVVGKQREIRKPVPVQTKKKASNFKLHRNEKILDSKPMAKDTFIVFSPPMPPADVKNTSGQDSVLPSVPEIQPVAENKPKERVLVVDIDLPDAPPTADPLLKTTFLQRFSQQARRLKTERKFDIKALDRKPGNGIWSFVGQSFVTPDAKQ